MSPAKLFSDLTPHRQKLIRLFQEVDFGQVLGLEIKNSDPVLNPSPAVLFDLKLDSDAACRTELGLPDFVLRDEVRRLMAVLDKLKNGKIERVEVRAGIPRRAVVEANFTEELL